MIYKFCVLQLKSRWIYSNKKKQISLNKFILQVNYLMILFCDDIFIN